MVNDEAAEDFRLLIDERVGKPVAVACGREDVAAVDGGATGAQHGLATFKRPLVRLVPYFDSYLLGHKERAHLVSLQHRPSIYRPQGRINSPAALRGMVEQCNLELNLTLFPDEVTAISAVLNRDHYRFK